MLSDSGLAWAWRFSSSSRVREAAAHGAFSDNRNAHLTLLIVNKRFTLIFNVKLKKGDFVTSIFYVDELMNVCVPLLDPSLWLRASPHPSLLPLPGPATLGAHPSVG